MELKKTALNQWHHENGAKMVSFAGFDMPVRYTSDIEEHKTVRNGVGIFDVSHMGEFMVRGPKALDLIQWVTSNDASKLFDGKVQYSCLPNDQGGIVDDLLVYRINGQEYMMVVNASNIEKDWNWLNQQNKVGADLEDISDQVSLFAVQGPHARQALQSLTELNLDEMEFYTFQKAKFGDVHDVIISATGYTGAGGFEIYLKNDPAVDLWNKIMEAGKKWDINPIGLGARDTLRLEMGFCLYGNDITDSTSPIEAGLGWITKFTKDFINSAGLRKHKEQGLNRKLVGIKMVDRGIPRPGYDIQNGSGEIIGRITSGTISPMLGVGIGLGYVKTEYKEADTNVYVSIRNKCLLAKVVKIPFYKG
ncbi:MAG: glycine cleavage system aminomethyltransferase GcvT [Bacteroidetes bacterium]|nr:glycine cleavage system aminomethyltransferase GcvT [Bacteroidota bacterium]